MSKEDKKAELDVLILLGFCALTVYAQAFSLVYKVGLAANILVLIADLCIIYKLGKEVFDILKHIYKETSLVSWCVVAVLAYVFLMITSTEAMHYDTGLYHAQSIRWIEEYGVVPGLGVLHNRIAYNSSIFSVEALFGMKYIFGQSLRGVNGFVVFVFAAYSVLSLNIFTRKKLTVSDLLRLVCIWNICVESNCSVISSSGSDLVALGLVIYIFIKWIDYTQDDEKSIEKYVAMCFLGVFAISVKLSAAMVVILVIIPAVYLLKNKKWKSIVTYLAIGLVIILPFFARNVIISGYLVYPFAELDLFNVDWKMPPYTLLYDRTEIKAWGKEICDVYKYNTPFSEWYPTWAHEMGEGLMWLLKASLVLAVPALIVAVIVGIKKRKWNYSVVLVAIFACLVYWYLGAPLQRYGKLYIPLCAVYILGSVLVYVLNKINIWKIESMAVCIAVMLLFMPMISYISGCRVHLVKQEDYSEKDWKDIEEKALYGLKILTPASGEQMGYYAFPSTPYSSRLDIIELRGNAITDGFRMKEEYRNANVTTYGYIDEKNIFE